MRNLQEDGSDNDSDDDEVFQTISCKAVQRIPRKRRRVCYDQHAEDAERMRTINFCATCKGLALVSHLSR